MKKKSFYTEIILSDNYEKIIFELYLQLYDFI